MFMYNIKIILFSKMLLHMCMLILILTIASSKTCFYFNLLFVKLSSVLDLLNSILFIYCTVPLMMTVLIRIICQLMFIHILIKFACHRLQIFFWRLTIVIHVNSIVILKFLHNIPKAQYLEFDQSEVFSDTLTDVPVNSVL